MLENPDSKLGAAPADAGGEEFDLRTYWRVLLRRRWTVATVFAAAVLITLVVTIRQTKIYAGTATIIIEVNSPKVLNTKDVQEVVESGSGGFYSGKEYFETQFKVITSRAVAQRVVDKLQLRGDLRFAGLEAEKDPKKVQAFLAKFDPVNEVQARLSVLPVRDSRVVRIQVEDRDPTWAATLANAVTEAYIAESLSVKSSTTQSASDWLESQLADLESKLDKSGTALFAFKQSHDIVATSWDDRQNMVSQRLTAINDALTKARVQRAQLGARAELLQRAASAMKSDPQAQSTMLVGANPALTELKIRYLDTKLECADLESRYLPNHPKIEGCAAKLAVARKSLDHELDTTVGGVQREFDETVEAEKRLQKLFDETKSNAFSLNQYEKDYLELKRAHENNQRLYDMVLQRLKETGVTGMLQMSNVRILDRARPSITPIHPSVKRNIGFALVLGLLGGIALAFLVDRLDRTIVGQEQIEERLGLTFLGIVPSIDKPSEGFAQEMVAYTHPKSSVAECIRTVRTNLIFMSPEKPLRTMLVTSSLPEEGKTTTATSLAITMADSGSRVLLVDADMRRPRLHRVFAVPNDAGLTTLIVGDQKLADLVRPTTVANLSFLPCGPVPPNPAELLHTEAFGRLVEQMAKEYDRIIIDSPPVGVVADAAVMAARVDGTVLVLKAAQTTREAARRAIRQLRDVKARIFGAVLNDVDLTDRMAGRYSYYTYGYYYGYGEKHPSNERRGEAKAL